MGQAVQAKVQEVLAGEIDQPLDGTVKSHQVEEAGIVAGMMDPATRGATTPTPVTPGATLTKMTGNLCLGVTDILIILMQMYCLH